VPCLDEDLRHINEQLLLILSDSVIRQQALKLLQISPLVAQRIAGADPNAIGTATRCHVPLVTFTPAVTGFLMSKPSTWRPVPQGDVPEALRELTRLTLMFARQLVQKRGAMVQAYFGLSREPAQALDALALTDVQRLADQFGVVLRLQSEDPEIWDELLIGQRGVGPGPNEIARHAIGWTLWTLLKNRRREARRGRDRLARGYHGTQGNGARGR
jgi:hypothetical protein